VVYDPSREELFVVQKGKGARLNGRSMTVSKTSRLSKSLLTTGFPYDLRESPVNSLLSLGKDNLLKFHEKIV